MAASGSAGNFQSIPALKPEQVPIPTTAGSVNMYMNLNDNLNIWTVDTFKVHRPVCSPSAYAYAYFNTPVDFNIFPGPLPFSEISDAKDITLGPVNTLNFQRDGVYKIDWQITGNSLGEDPQTFILAVNGVDVVETKYESPNSPTIVTTTGHAELSIAAGNTLQIKNVFPFHFGIGNASVTLGMTINKVS